MNGPVYLYILSDQSNAVLALGIARDLKAYLHDARQLIKQRSPKKQKQKEAVMKLVWYEIFNDSEVAFERERELRQLPRAQKLELIEEQNPKWQDLSTSL